METLQDLVKEYRSRFAGVAEYRDRVWGVLTKRFFQSFISESASVLDLGAGHGEFIRNIAASEKIAMDLNPDCQKFVGPSVRVLLQDCSLSWPMAPDSLDVVFTSNFFEHLPDKDSLRRTLHEVGRVLKPGGRIICMGPNIRLLPGAYWDFWDHYLPLTELSLAEVLGLAGFEIEVCYAAFLPYSMSQGWRPPVWLLSVYLQMPWFWRFFGKQFLVVAKWPGNRANEELQSVKGCVKN